MADYDFIVVWSLYCMYQPYWVCGSKGYLVHIAHIPPAVEWKIAYMVKFGCPCFHNRGRPCVRLWFYGSLDPKLYVPAILDPWVQGFLVHIAHIPALLWNQNRVYGLVWDAVVPTNEGVPVADYDLMASLECCHSHKRGSPYGRFWFHCSLDHFFYLPAILGLWVQGLLGTYSPNSPILENEKCIYGQVSGIRIPVNWRVFQVDAHFVVGMALYYSCH